MDPVDQLLLHMANDYMDWLLAHRKGGPVRLGEGQLAHILRLPTEMGRRAAELLVEHRPECSGSFEAICPECVEGYIYFSSLEVTFPVQRVCDYCGEEVPLERDDCQIKLTEANLLQAIYPLRDGASSLRRDLEAQGLDDLAEKVREVEDNLQARVLEHVEQHRED